MVRHAPYQLEVIARFHTTYTPIRGITSELRLFHGKTTSLLGVRFAEFLHFGWVKYWEAVNDYENEPRTGMSPRSLRHRRRPPAGSRIGTLRAYAYRARQPELRVAELGKGDLFPIKDNVLSKVFLKTQRPIEQKQENSVSAINYLVGDFLGR